MRDPRTDDHSRRRNVYGAIEEAYYSCRGAGNSAYDDSGEGEGRRHRPSPVSCITDLDGLDWRARAALFACSPPDRLYATRAAAIRPLRDVATSARATAGTIAPSTESETVAATEAARQLAQSARTEVTAMAAAAAAVAAATAMAEAGARAERLVLEGASKEEATMAHTGTEGRAAAATEQAAEALRQAHTLHTPCTHLAHTLHTL